MKEDVNNTSPLQQAKKLHFDAIVKIIEEHQQNSLREPPRSQVVRRGNCSTNSSHKMPRQHKQPASETRTIDDYSSYEPTVKKARPLNSDFENKVIKIKLRNNRLNKFRSLHIHRLQFSLHRILINQQQHLLQEMFLKSTDSPNIINNRTSLPQLCSLIIVRVL